MRRQRFEELVREALTALPAQFRQRLDNVEVVIEDWPSPAQLAEAGLGPQDSLFGLYEGIPLTERGSGYGMVLPDKITIFQGPIEALCTTEEEIRQEVQDVVIHEIAHFFGLSDAELEELGR